MSQKLGAIATGLVRKAVAARAAGEGPRRLGAQLGFAKVCKAAGADPNISDTTYRVLGLVAAYADEDGYCWPAVATLAKERGVTRQAIQHHLRILVANGYIEKQERKRKNGGYGPNLYRIVILYADKRAQKPQRACGEVRGALPSGNLQNAFGALPEPNERDASELDCIEAAE